jgi:catechol 2,3-dioxygenase-like lactoylglutathione lyase family enzyme
METTEAAEGAATARMAAGDIDTEIYPMPGFVTFQVVDLRRSTRWYVDGLGFVVLAELPGPGGEPVLVHLRRHRYQDVLLVARGPADPDAGQAWGLGVRYSVRAGGEDLKARAELVRAVGGEVDGPSRTPWNTVDLVCRDPDGYEVVLTEAVSAGLEDEQFSDTVRRSVRG